VLKSKAILSILDKIEPRNLWYIVGYIATDGCLLNNGRSIAIVSKDKQILDDMNKALGLSLKLIVHKNGFGGSALRLHIGSVELYRFLLKIGLTTRKSLTLGPLGIPNNYFADFFRGVIDGDGCIRGWVNASNNYPQWSLTITSGSYNFVSWLQEKLFDLCQVKGRIHSAQRKDRKNRIYILKFGKTTAREILKKCYYGNCLVLERKNKIAQDCISVPNLFKTYGNVVARVL